MLAAWSNPSLAGACRLPVGQYGAEEIPFVLFREPESQISPCRRPLRRRPAGHDGRGPQLPPGAGRWRDAEEIARNAGQHVHYVRTTWPSPISRQSWRSASPPENCR
ncbi:MAG: hypothetical protein IPJ94_10975 [Chloroflexi bacterium]|nr:hypothetical protein [Chloroflexota bacterium]